LEAPTHKIIGGPKRLDVEDRLSTIQIHSRYKKEALYLCISLEPKAVILSILQGL
jgi:hypothetical protein